MILVPGEGCLGSYLCSSRRLALQASEPGWLMLTLLEIFFPLKPDGIIHFFFWERFLAHGTPQTVPRYWLWVLAGQAWQCASLHQLQINSEDKSKTPEPKLPPWTRRWPWSFDLPQHTNKLLVLASWWLLLIKVWPGRKWKISKKKR